MGDLVQAGHGASEFLVCESLKVRFIETEENISGLYPWYSAAWLFIDRKHASGTEIIMKPDTAIRIW